MDVFRDRLLVSVLMRARPVALGWGSILEAAVWGGNKQAMQPEVTARGAPSGNSESAPEEQAWEQKPRPSVVGIPGNLRGLHRPAGQGKGSWKPPVSIILHHPKTYGCDSVLSSCAGFV